MAFCTNCGQEMPADAKFCSNCGTPINHADTYKTAKREAIYEGEVHKCPNCGEILNSFELNCPACGYELRGNKASSAVKEFASKLEAIESNRECKKSSRFFASVDAQQRISKTDEQKISLIKSFSVPNSKEDMIEFMILATSSMNMHTYDSFAATSMSKSEKELNAAWFAKVQQVYEKAKRSYSADSTFTEIQALYDKCNERIKYAKKKGTAKWVLTIGWMPILLVVLLIVVAIFGPKWEAEELERLDSIVLDVQQALDSGEYSYALRIAETIDYQRSDAEMERKWDLQREYWIEKVLEEAAANGEDLTYMPSSNIDDMGVTADDDTNDVGGFISGFVHGFNTVAQPSFDKAKNSIDEFNCSVNEAFK